MSSDNGMDPTPAPHTDHSASYPTSKPSVKDSGLYQLKPQQLKALLAAKQVKHDDCLDKDDLVRRAMEHGISPTDKVDAAPSSSASSSSSDESKRQSSSGGSGSGSGESGYQHVSHPTPSSHASVHDHPLYRASIHELKQILIARQIRCDDCLDKEDLVKRAIEHGINSLAQAKAQQPKPQPKPQQPAVPTGVVTEVNDENKFRKVLSSADRVVVDFYAHWCGPCRQISPFMEQLAKQQQSVVFVKCDVDKAQELASEFSISGIPAIKMFYKGQERKELGVVGADTNKIRNNVVALAKL